MIYKPDHHGALTLSGWSQLLLRPADARTASEKAWPLAGAGETLTWGIFGPYPKFSLSVTWKVKVSALWMRYSGAGQAGACTCPLSRDRDAACVSVRLCEGFPSRRGCRLSSRCFVFSMILVLGALVVLFKKWGFIRWSDSSFIP